MISDRTSGPCTGRRTSWLASIVESEMVMRPRTRRSSCLISTTFCCSVESSCTQSPDLSCFERIGLPAASRPVQTHAYGLSPFGRFFPDQMTPGSQSGGMSSTAWTFGSRRRMSGPNDVAEEERVDRVDEMRMSEIAAQRVPDFFATDACERERGETGVPLCPAREFRADDLGDHPRLSTPGGRANESNACRILDDRALVRRGRSHAAVLARVVRPPGTRTL